MLFRSLDGVQAELHRSLSTGHRDHPKSGGYAGAGHPQLFPGTGETRVETWLEWRWLGVFIALNHQFNRWGRLLSMGAPDSPVHHRTLFGAPATSPSRWILIVGASDIWSTGQSGGAPNRHCLLSGAPSGAALTSARAGAHCLLSLFICR